MIKHMCSVQCALNLCYMLHVRNKVFHFEPECERATVPTFYFQFTQFTDCTRTPPPPKPHQTIIMKGIVIQQLGPRALKHQSKDRGREREGGKRGKRLERERRENKEGNRVSKR